MPAQDEAAAGGLQHRHVHVVPAQDRRRATRSGPVPGLHHALVHEDPVVVVVPTWCPARSRMWVISRVTVDLPLVPVMDTTGIRRSASRIQDGGVAPASAIRASQRATRRFLGHGQADPAGGRDRPAREIDGRLGDQAGPLGAGPGPGDHPAAGIRRPVDDRRTRVLAVVGAQPPGPGHDVRDGVRPLARPAPGGARCTSGRRRRGSASPSRSRVRPTATSTLTTGSSR